MKDKIKEFKRVWQYNGALHIMFLDQYNRYRTFKEYYGEFQEVTFNGIVSDYKLILNSNDSQIVKREVEHFRAMNRSSGGHRYGL